MTMRRVLWVVLALLALACASRRSTPPVGDENKDGGAWVFAEPIESRGSSGFTTDHFEENR